MSAPVAHRARRRCSRLTAALLIPLQLSACMSWQSHPAPATAAAEGADVPPSSVRLTLHDGTRQRVYGPVARNDSVIGTRTRGGTDSVAVAAAAIRASEVRRIDGSRTGGLVVGIGLLMLAASTMIDTGP